MTAFEIERRIRTRRRRPSPSARRSASPALWAERRAARARYESHVTQASAAWSTMSR